MLTEFLYVSPRFSLMVGISIILILLMILAYLHGFFLLNIRVKLLLLLRIFFNLSQFSLTLSLKSFSVTMSPKCALLFYRSIWRHSNEIYMSIYISTKWERIEKTSSYCWNGSHSFFPGSSTSHILGRCFSNSHIFYQPNSNSYSWWIYIDPNYEE